MTRKQAKRRAARLTPAEPEKPGQFTMPDIMARLDRTFGNRAYSAKQVAAMRAAELEGEEG
jgi:hypothetical protein